MPDHEDRDWGDFIRARTEEIPVPLPARSVLRGRDPEVFWVDGFRGYSTGISFSASYRWDHGEPPHEDPDAWPNLIATMPGGPPIVITVSVDGERFSNLRHGDGALHPTSSNGLPGIISAGWWLPRVPARALTIHVSHEWSGLFGELVVSVDGWESMVRDHVIVSQ